MGAGKGGSREASSAPPYTLPKFPLSSGSSRHLVLEGSSVWLAPCCLPSPISQPGGDFLPGTSYIPSRAAYSSCSCPGCRPQCPAPRAWSAYSWELASHSYGKFQRGSPGVLPVTCLPLPGLCPVGSRLLVGQLSSVRRPDS